MCKLIRAFLLIAILTAAAIANAETKLQPGFNVFTTEQDVEVGKESAVKARSAFAAASGVRRAGKSAFNVSNCVSNSATYGHPRTSCDDRG